MLLLPEEPMRPRLFDQRVAMISISQTDYGDEAQFSKNNRFVTRFRLEPSDEEAYLRGSSWNLKNRLSSISTPLRRKSGGPILFKESMSGKPLLKRQDLKMPFVQRWRRKMIPISACWMPATRSCDM